MKPIKLDGFYCAATDFVQKHFLCPGHKIWRSATNVARADKRGNICVGNNVSATMCPRLPGP